MRVQHYEELQVGDLVWVGTLDTRAVQWVQDIYRKRALVVVPRPAGQIPFDGHRTWVHFNNRVHLIPTRYLKILSKC